MHNDFYSRASMFMGNKAGGIWLLMCLISVGRKPGSIKDMTTD